MPEKMSNSYKDSTLKTPLSVGKNKGEPGPDVNNPPIARPSDPLKFMPGGRSPKK